MCLRLIVLGDLPGNCLHHQTVRVRPEDNGPHFRKSRTGDARTRLDILGESRRVTSGPPAAQQLRYPLGVCLMSATNFTTTPPGSEGSRSRRSLPPPLNSACHGQTSRKKVTKALAPSPIAPKIAPTTSAASLGAFTNAITTTASTTRPTNLAT